MIRNNTVDGVAYYHGLLQRTLGELKRKDSSKEEKDRLVQSLEGNLIGICMVIPRNVEKKITYSL